MGAAVQDVERLKTKTKVSDKLRKDDSEHQMDTDVVLVATGRKPVTDALAVTAMRAELCDPGTSKTTDK